MIMMNDEIKEVRKTIMVWSNTHDWLKKKSIEIEWSMGFIVAELINQYGDDVIEYMKKSPKYIKDGIDP